MCTFVSTSRVSKKLFSTVKAQAIGQCMLMQSTYFIISSNEYTLRIFTSYAAVYAIETKLFVCDHRESNSRLTRYAIF